MPMMMVNMLAMAMEMDVGPIIMRMGMQVPLVFIEFDG
jgi:hypothetical protein